MGLIIFSFFLQYFFVFPFLYIFNKHLCNIDKESKCHEHNHWVAHSVLLLFVNVKISKAKHVVTGKHYHRFVKNFKKCMAVICMRMKPNYQYDVQRCEEAKNLKLYCWRFENQNWYSNILDPSKQEKWPVVNRIIVSPILNSKIHVFIFCFELFFVKISFEFEDHYNHHNNYSIKINCRAYSN